MEESDPARRDVLNNLLRDPARFFFIFQRDENNCSRLFRNRINIDDDGGISSAWTVVVEAMDHRDVLCNQ